MPGTHELVSEGDTANRQKFAENYKPPQTDWPP